MATHVHDDWLCKFSKWLFCQWNLIFTTILSLDISSTTWTIYKLVGASLAYNTAHHPSIKQRTYSIFMRLDGRNVGGEQSVKVRGWHMASSNTSSLHLLSKVHYFKSLYTCWSTIAFSILSSSNFYLSTWSRLTYLNISNIYQNTESLYLLRYRSRFIEYFFIRSNLQIQILQKE